MVSHRVPSEPGFSLSGDWTVSDAIGLYRIDRWGDGHFEINGQGDITAHPFPDSAHAISVYAVLQEAIRKGLKPPLIIRFLDILRHRVQSLNEAFCAALKDYDYVGTYQTVYPIKVNQLKEVVEEIVEAGKPFGTGLEVSSKAELHAAMALLGEDDQLLVCNGYKDKDFIRVALMRRKLGKKIILVAEKLSEIVLIGQTAKRMNVVPWVGLRIRLSVDGSGNWARSTGELAKFGLSTAEILRAIEILEEAGLRKSLRLLHYHVGSQIPDILTIKGAIREAVRFYAKLRGMGYPIDYLDVGGGLAVDYDGSYSTSCSSKNYTVSEYARDIVSNTVEICAQEGVPQPSLLSESGRALTAHHSVLVVRAFGSIRKTPDRMPRELPSSDHSLVRDLLALEQSVSQRNFSESWNSLLQSRLEAQKLFDVGMLGLAEKASIEILYWRIARAIQTKFSQESGQAYPEGLAELDEQLTDQHICNFSLFQSLLDHWALGQIFPVVPIHRLNEKPENRSALVDITCDSDGRVSRFLGRLGVTPNLPLHHFGKDPYYLGIFLVGAYQDIMGDIHNLFGRENEVHIYSSSEAPNGFKVENQISATTLAEVLEMTEYAPDDLIERMRLQVQDAIKSRKIDQVEGTALLQGYMKGFEGQTYLDLKAD